MKNLIFLISFVILVKCGFSEKKDSRYSAPTSDFSQSEDASVKNSEVVEIKKDQSQAD